MLYMEDARRAFSEACGTFNRYNSESEFYHRLAQMIPNRVDVDTLMLDSVLHMNLLMNLEKNLILKY